MSKKALEDAPYELIKAHALDPDSSPLSLEQQQLYDRVVSVAKVLDKNPIQKQAVAIHQAKFPDISRSQAYQDVRMAVKLFNTLHTFDWDFWHSWLLNDIVRNIEKLANDGSPAARKVVAMEHANLIKAVGEKPKELEDPKRLEKNAFYILIQNNSTTVKVDVNNLHNLPEATLRELNRAIFAGKEITDIEAEEILKT